MKHPIYICDLRSKEPTVTHGAKLVAYQDARTNGWLRLSPAAQLQSDSSTLHALRLWPIPIGVDLTAPHRPGISPYAAIEHLLEGTQPAISTLYLSGLYCT